MNLKNNLASASQILGSRIFDIETPVALRWNLTYRCNLNCQYCNLPEKADRENELSTRRIKEILHEMSECGVRRISFSGGEPLLREDIGEIIDCASEVGISPTMNTNGILLPEKMDELENLELAKISMDGAKKNHNRLRGEYDETIEGIKTALSKGLDMTLCTTFTKENYRDLKHLVKLADKYGTVIAIQRASNLYENFDEAEKLLPDREEIESTLEGIMRMKGEISGAIRNSMRHLKLIKNYPEHEKIRCTAGKIFCMVMPDGEVIPCDRIPVDEDPPNLKKVGFEEAFSELNRVDCYGCCFCGSMELNYLYHLKLDVLKDLFNFFTSPKDNNTRGSSP